MLVSPANAQWARRQIYQNLMMRLNLDDSYIGKIHIHFYFYPDKRLYLVAPCIYCSYKMYFSIFI